MNQEADRYIKFIRTIRDRRIPRFGGHDYRGWGKGHGRFFLALTLNMTKRNGKAVFTNEAF
jgi:hypothetical protein